MSVVEVVLVAVAIISNIGVCVLAVYLCRLLRQGQDQLAPDHLGDVDLDPETRWRLQRLAEEWASSRGRPEVTRWAEGYLSDAAAYAQRRWGRVW